MFSISRNKIHKIPPYFSQFRNLEMFKADQNPLEWPPKDIMEAPHSKKEDMKEWIWSVQRWIEDNSSTIGKHWVDEPSTLTEDTDSVLETIL